VTARSSRSETGGLAPLVRPWHVELSTCAMFRLYIMPTADFDSYHLKGVVDVTFDVILILIVPLLTDV
jgi:hypothetical protein